jgi:tRNA(Arg) A34 adenosine deaminase TadA
MVTKGEQRVDLVRRTIELALENVENGGRPFACVISRDGEVVAENPNLVVQTRDPTAHAEIVVVRQACQRPETENLEGHEIYVLAHPCPMCLGALYYCSPDRMALVTTRDEYSRYYKDDRKYFELENFYDEFPKPWQERRLPMEHGPNEEGVEVYRRWREFNP